MILYNTVMVFAVHQHELANMCSPLSWTSLPPPSPLYLSGLSQSTGFVCPASCIELALVFLFTYGNIYVSVLFSQIIPPSLLLHSPKFCSLHLCLFTVLHIGSLLPFFWIPCICVNMLYWCFSFWLISLCIIASISLELTQMCSFLTSQKNWIVSVEFSKTSLATRNQRFPLWNQK